MLKKYRFIIWDWNGTLYNDVFVGMDTVNEMLIERGIAPMTLSVYKDIFTFPIIDYYKKAGFDFEKEPYEQLATVFIEKNNKRLGESGLFEHVENTLDAVKMQGCDQLILSATRQDILIEQINFFNLGHYFVDLLGNVDFYAHSKAEIAKKWLESSSVPPAEVLIIGDTLHDHEVADTLGCDCILISNGHQSHERLTKSGKTVIPSLSKFLEMIKI